MVSGVDRGMGVLDEGDDRRSFGVNFGRPIVGLSNGTLLCSCARATRYSKITLGRTCLYLLSTYSKHMCRRILCAL